MLIAALWPIVGYKKIDDYKVELQTKGVDTLMPSLLNRFTIASPANFEKVGKDWQAYRKSPSGTGPWKMVAWTPRERAELERNTDYWNKDRIPKTERMVLLPVPDVSTRTAALLSGRVDWIEAPAPNSLEKLKAGGCKIETNAIPHMWPYTLSMLPGAPTADIRVRKAINLAIDRDAMVKLLNGLAVPAVGCVPPDHPWFGNPSFKIKYDPTEARKLMAEAGYGPQKRLKMKVAISTSGSGQMYPLLMNEFIQQQFAEIGVDMDFQVMDWNALLNLMRQGRQVDRGRAVRRHQRELEHDGSAQRLHALHRQPADSTQGLQLGLYPGSRVRQARRRGAQHVRSGGTRQGAGQDQYPHGRRGRIRLGGARRVAQCDLFQSERLRPSQKLVRRFLTCDRGVAERQGIS